VPCAFLTSYFGEVWRVVERFVPNFGRRGGGEEGFWSMRFPRKNDFLLHYK
jgi:hypothetical protein